MSRKSTVTKAVVKLESRSIAQDMEGVHKAIETGVVDVHTIATLRKLLAPQTTATTSITMSSTLKTPALASSRSKKSSRTTEIVTATLATSNPFPGTELVCATKTVIMKSLHTLGTEAEKRAKTAESTLEAEGGNNSTKQPPNQGIRNILACCKAGLEALRKWQDHQDIGVSWVNKAYFGYIGKLISLEMPETAVKELTALKTEIETQLQLTVPKSKSSISTKKKLQTSTKQNLPVAPPPTFDPLPLLSMHTTQDTLDEESITLICAYFNHVLRAIGAKSKYDVEESFIAVLEAQGGPISWINRLPSKQSAHQSDNFSRALIKIVHNCKTPEVQLSLRTLRHRLAINQPSANVGTIAKSILQALRTYYAATKSDKEAYTLCKDVISPVLEKLIGTIEGAKVVDFMGLIARKASLLSEAMKWNDLGLRKCSEAGLQINALYLLRNAGILFALPKEDIDCMDENLIQERLKYTTNCLASFENFDGSSEALKDELDYLRRCILSSKSEILQSSPPLKDARGHLPRKILRALIHLADLNSSLIPKMTIAVRTLISDVLNSLRDNFCPTSPPQNYLSILDLCQKAACKIQDNLSLQYTGNQYFNFGNAFQNAGKRREARKVLERSLELDFSPIVAHGSMQPEQSEEEKRRGMTARCRKLEMLGECCSKGEEKDAFALILEALNIHIESLDLADQVATMSLQQVMKKEEYLKRLIGCLTRFTKDQSDWSPEEQPTVDEEFEITLHDTTSPETKALVYEIQVHILLGMTHKGRHATARKICHKALGIYTEMDCPLRWARVIERLLYLSIVDGEDVKDILDIGTRCIDTLVYAKTFGKDEGLHGSRKLIFARCLAWMGLLADNTDSPKQDFFSQALAIWSRWSEKALHEPKEEETSELNELTSILELLSDFFEVKSLSLLRIQSYHLLLKIQSHLTNNLDVIIPLYTSLAVQYLRLGYTGKAGTLFAQGLKKMQNSAPSTSIQLQWHIHYAEYFARIGVIAKAKAEMSQAGEIYTKEFGTAKKRLDPNERALRILAVGRAGYVFSLIAFEENELEKAIGFIDYSIRVLRTAITNLERSTRTVKTSSSDFDPFSSEKRPLSEIINVENKGLQFGSRLWAYKSAFFAALLQHGILLTFRGSAREGEFWFRQAYEAAKSIKAWNSVLLSALHLGDLFTRMSILPTAHEFLSEAAELVEAVEKTKDGVVMEMNLYGLHGRKETWGDAFRSIVKGEGKLKKLLEPAFVNGLEKGEGMDLVERFRDMRISLGSPARKVQGRSPKSSRRQTGKSSTNVSRVEYESVTFSRMQVTIAENKAYSLARQKLFEEGYLAMDSISGMEKLVLETLSAKVAKARMLLLEVYQLLESDPLLCVLSESAISIPSVHGKPSTTDTETKPSRGKRVRQRSGNKMLQSTGRFQSLLTEAREMIESIFERACALCPSTLAPVVSHLMSEVRLLSSIVSASDIDQNLLALKTIMLLDRSRSVTYRREQAALEYLAKQDHISYIDVQWPEQTPRPDSSHEDLTDMLSSLSMSTNKRTLPMTAEEILHGIPAGCTVISINLSESREHFVISKVHPQGCVVVRLPLLKHPPDGEEEPFTFANAYSELSEIIRFNNESAQAAKDVPDRAAKEIWWTTRMELDSRLSLFLQNMETCWIGGFTGMFRGFFPNDDLFTKFRMAFRQILIKFLPSRKEGDIQMELDPRLVDLFLSLTTENKDQTDVADQVEDLICFALDNFKFHGEQIAIDEVDLDAVSPVEEAIRCYHEAAPPKKQDHVILILDKALHMFPWESLPCLRGRSVSRLPSLGTMMERVVMSPIEGAMWPSVTANKGFFVLNPSGDLKHTQSQFETPLSKIDGWNGIVGRAPMDQEVLSALRNNDIYLYFGHGSGEQYVKSAQIKRLQNSALTMLFGCSSGKLREAGDFEAWGTPITYLLGGSPAVLANLWDVTDRDIDRLSYGVFSRWGLCEGERPRSRGLDEGQFEPEKGMGLDFKGGSIGERKRQLQASIRGKKLVATRKGVSLSEALAMAREDCTLKYLNGAAPVIYGVPVFLEERN